MKSIIAILSLIVVSSTSFAFQGSCIYSDNKVISSKPNGSILIIPFNSANYRPNESVILVDLNETSNILQAKATVNVGSTTLEVSNSNGKVLFRKYLAEDSGTNFLTSAKSAQASLVCIPNL